MKLFNSVLIHLLTGIALILVGWAVVFYLGIMEEINDEVDDALENYSELIIIRSLAGVDLPSTDSGSNNQFFLKKVSSDYAESRERICYRDSMVYIAEKHEAEPARILTTIFKDRQEQYYELSVYTPTFEREDLREAIFQLLVVLFFLLLFTILLINIWVFRRSMKPFYVLLGWLDGFRLGKNNEALNNPTYTTEFQKLNETVSRFAAHSEEMFEQQKQFIGNASHEIQTPLAICQNRLEMLMEDESLNESQMEELVKTYQTLEYVSKLNRSLLLLSKIDNSQFVETREVCFNEFVHRYAADYQEVFAYLKINFNVVEKSDFRMQINETLATVLVINLLKNSFVHNVEGGSVRIEISKEEMVFSNTGIESSLDRKRIFERFYQGNKKDGSTGLGLAIVSAICRQFDLYIGYGYENGLHRFTLKGK